MDVLNHGGELYRITEAVQGTNQEWRVSSGEVPLVSIRLTLLSGRILRALLLTRFGINKQKLCVVQGYCNSVSIWGIGQFVKRFKVEVVHLAGGDFLDFDATKITTDILESRHAQQSFSIPTQLDVSVEMESILLFPFQSRPNIPPVGIENVDMPLDIGQSKGFSVFGRIHGHCGAGKGKRWFSRPSHLINQY